jgi:Ion channel
MTKAPMRPDLFLVSSLLLVILIYPLLDHGDLQRMILGALFFLPVILATYSLSQLRGWLWPSALTMSGALICAVASSLYPSRALVGVKWSILTVFFGLTVAGLFSYIKNARTILDKHLYTAVSIYLLLGMQWFALYSAINIFYPGAIQHGTGGGDRQSELLYFSLVTLSTIGYGDVVPIHGEVRMLAALEGMTGVLYIAITVALLVSSYKQEGTSGEPRSPTP